MKIKLKKHLSPLLFHGLAALLCWGFLWGAYREGIGNWSLTALWENSLEFARPYFSSPGYPSFYIGILWANLCYYPWLGGFLTGGLVFSAYWFIARMLGRHLKSEAIGAMFGWAALLLSLFGLVFNLFPWLNLWASWICLLALFLLDAHLHYHPKIRLPYIYIYIGIGLSVPLLFYLAGGWAIWYTIGTAALLGCHRDKLSLKKGVAALVSGGLAVGIWGWFSVSCDLRHFFLFPFPWAVYELADSIDPNASPLSNYWLYFGREYVWVLGLGLALCKRSGNREKWTVGITGVANLLLIGYGITRAGDIRDYNRLAALERIRHEWVLEEDESVWERGLQLSGEYFLRQDMEALSAAYNRGDAPLAPWFGEHLKTALIARHALSDRFYQFIEAPTVFPLFHPNSKTPYYMAGIYSLLGMEIERLYCALDDLQGKIYMPPTALLHQVRAGIRLGEAKALRPPLEKLKASFIYRKYAEKWEQETMEAKAGTDSASCTYLYSTLIPRNILEAFSKDSTHPRLLDIMISEALFYKDLESVMEWIPLLKEAGYTRLPRHVEEAVLTAIGYGDEGCPYSAQNIRSFRIHGFGIREETAHRCDYFLHKSNLARMGQYDPLAFKKEFINSYWYYYMFGNPE